MARSDHTPWPGSEGLHCSCDDNTGPDCDAESSPESGGPPNTAREACVGQRLHRISLSCVHRKSSHCAVRTHFAHKTPTAKITFALELQAQGRKVGLLPSPLVQVMPSGARFVFPLRTVYYAWPINATVRTSCPVLHAPTLFWRSSIFSSKINSNLSSVSTFKARGTSRGNNPQSECLQHLWGLGHMHGPRSGALADCVSMGSLTAAFLNLIFHVCIPLSGRQESHPQGTPPPAPAGR